jgi:hypothetical protein
MTNSSRGNSYSSSPALAAPVAKVLALTPTQDDLVRQLGGAIVLQWDALPDALQDLLIDQAAIGPNGEDARFTPALIENFIRKAKTKVVRQLQPSEGGHALQTA